MGSKEEAEGEDIKEEEVVVVVWLHQKLTNKLPMSNIVILVQRHYLFILVDTYLHK